MFSVEFVAALCSSVTTGETASADTVDVEVTVVTTDCTDDDSADVTAATSVTACVTLLTDDCGGLVTEVDT